MGTTYEKYPKPHSDMKASRSAKEVGKTKGAGQESISGTMGKHQKTGSGKEYGGSSHNKM